MWRAVNADGSLTYTFIESVAAIHIYDVLRWFGGAVFLAGFVVMLFNVTQTIRQGSAQFQTPDPASLGAATEGGRA